MVSRHLALHHERAWILNRMADDPGAARRSAPALRLTADYRPPDAAQAATTPASAAGSLDGLRLPNLRGLGARTRADHPQRAIPRTQDAGDERRVSLRLSTPEARLARFEREHKHDTASLFLRPQRDSAVAQLCPIAVLLRFVQHSSERTLEPARRHSSFAEKQESHPPLLLVVRSGRLTA